MRHSLFACSFGAVLLWAGGALADDWQVYTAPDHSFSISFPSAPKEGTDGDAKTVTADPSEHESYIVEITPLNAPKEYMSDKLFAAANKSFTDGGGAIVSLNDFTFSGHPAEDVEIRTKEGYIAWDRLIVVNDHVYQLLHIADTGDAKPDQFWNSFGLGT